MLTETIIHLAGKNCSGVTGAGEYVFTHDELLWFVNDLSTTERLSTPPAPDTTAEGILKKHSDSRFSIGMPFNYDMLIAAMEDYANQKQIPLSAFDKFKVSGPHLEDNPFYTLRKTDLEGIIGKCL